MSKRVGLPGDLISADEQALIPCISPSIIDRLNKKWREIMVDKSSSQEREQLFLMLKEVLVHLEGQGVGFTWEGDTDNRYITFKNLFLYGTEFIILEDLSNYGKCLEKRVVTRLKEGIHSTVRLSDTIFIDRISQARARLPKVGILVRRILDRVLAVCNNSDTVPEGTEIIEGENGTNPLVQGEALGKGFKFSGVGRARDNKTTFTERYREACLREDNGDRPPGFYDDVGFQRRPAGSD